MRLRDRFDLPDQHDAEYWRAIRAWAEELGSDGCTWAFDWRLDTCLEHDCHWRTGYTLFGDPISKWEANQCFREAIADRSRVKRWVGFSPMAAFRFGGVSIGALFHKDKKES